MKKSGAPFYLTGGTALSRHYFGHRYSDDLDLFLDNRIDFAVLVEHLIQDLDTKIKGFRVDRERTRKAENFLQTFIIPRADLNFSLKIDLVNDTVPHYGDFENSPVLGQIDSWRNILSNKVCALFRFEAKDIADIWTLSKNRAFDWRAIIKEAKNKEIGIDPVAFFEIINSVPVEALQTVKWTSSVDFNILKTELSTIADDVFRGRENTLFRLQR
ncbi:MAG: nucleotidyl transferase AbiEii/AbiGii toxin family protein [Candidatus Wallbacteria bacterium]|nr:nucleotidyl transferase AbiEii/AbiGii toxin family protein [Candidatus Wallbacteria bacterium]